ncbi:MAG: glycosyl transferase [Symploca sp. SIO2B6]|nr:glycosyl transferase [Symploca sp. SIO2B6]
MSRPVLYIAITNHGFGHAVRASSVAAAIQRRCPEILLILVTTAPRWLLESYIPGDFIYRPRSFDIGVIQADSLAMDKEATLEKLRHIRASAPAIIASEVNFIRNNRVNLILADIPPLATSLAKAAGIECWMMSNFGWDFIYRYWGGEFMEIAEWISQLYGECNRTFRLPFHEAMSAFNNITDVGLTGGTPRYDCNYLRQKFGLSASVDKTVLLTFGGLGIEQIPYKGLSQFSEWNFITFDQQAPDLPNIIKITDHNYRPVDFMPLCGRVVSKPGYSTFAEALRVGTPIVSLTREDFAEAPLLLEGLKDSSEYQILPVSDFFQGKWEFLHQTPQPPRQSQKIAKDGEEAIAQTVVSYLSTGKS